MKHVLIAGASGYLGRYLVQEAKRRGYRVRILLRRDPDPDIVSLQPDEVFIGQASDQTTLKGLCDDIDGVISTLGITRQKDGLSYLDVDYGANHNILERALESNVDSFAYVSVFNGPALRSAKMVEAKELFVEELLKSAIRPLVIRPTGFFSDMGDFLAMARKGRVYIFGDGSVRLNPIHGEDLATAIFDAYEAGETELNIGGPVTYTIREIGEAAIGASGGKGKVIALPDVLRRILLRILPRFTPQKVYGPLQFFLTAMASDMAAPEHGSRRLDDFFKEGVRDV